MYPPGTQPDSGFPAAEEDPMVRARLALVGMVVLAASSVSPAGADGQTIDRKANRLEWEVRHELYMLPYFGVFDHLAFTVEPGGKVTLFGQVRRPTLKSDAESVVKDIPGVDTVSNKIEVLPVSQNDDRIRLRTYRAVYRDTNLERYAIQAVPPIHIIVKNGHVTLEGAVGSEMDKTDATLKARGVSGVFSVTNNLRVEP
jgi:hyperosmotically inducible periplasmic protein